MENDLPLPPSFYTYELPADEHENANFIFDNMLTMRGYVDRFRYALMLFDKTEADIHAAQGRRNAIRDKLDPGTWEHHQVTQAYHREIDAPIAWQQMACRDATMTLSHFGKAMGHSKHLANRSATLNRMISEKALQEPFALFHRSFPGLSSMRNSVAHEVEFWGDPKEIKHHTTSDRLDIPGAIFSEGMNVLISGNMGRAVTYTGPEKRSGAGKLHTFNLDQATLDRLRSIMINFFDVFRDVERQTLELAKALKSMPPRPS